MFAVLRQGGHQYRVSAGDIIQIEKIDAEKGQTLELDDVLAIGEGESLEIGEPRVAGAIVSATVIREGRGKKIRGYKFKRRKGYQRRYGHRQPFVEIKINSISKDGKELS